MDIVIGLAYLLQIAMGVTLIWLSVRRITTGKKPLTMWWKIGLAYAILWGFGIIASTLMQIAQ